MILLSLNAAARYILTFLLAVLGIIPFEEIEFPTDGKASQVQTAGMRTAIPLEHMEALPFRAVMLQTAVPLPEQELAAIGERSEFPVACPQEVECRVAVAGRDRACEYIIEVRNLEQAAEKVILLYADELETHVLTEFRTPGLNN